MTRFITFIKPLKSTIQATLFASLALFCNASFTKESLEKKYVLIDPNQIEIRDELKKSAETIAKLRIEREREIAKKQALELEKEKKFIVADANLDQNKSYKIKKNNEITNQNSQQKPLNKIPQNSVLARKNIDDQQISNQERQNPNNAEKQNILAEEIIKKNENDNKIPTKDSNPTKEEKPDFAGKVNENQLKNSQQIISKNSKNNLKYLPRIDLNYKQGNKRNLGRSEALIPIWQDNKSIVFADVRGWIDSNSAKEGNLGIGYRKIINDEFILGGYGFFDHKVTDSGNSFNQNTFGAEILTENLDFRGNIYLPKEDKKETANSKQNNLLQGSNVIIGNKSFEVTHKGFDLEFGSKIPFIKDLSLFYTYYHFENKDPEVVNSNINGNKIRGEYGLFSKKIQNLFLEGEYSDDNFRGANSFVGLRYSLNFSDQKNLSALEKRMTNPIYRDNDVVIEKVDGVLSKLKNSAGQDVKIIYVDGSVASTGDGTFEKPYQTLAEAQNASKINDLIYVYYNGGNVYDGNIELKDNQKLIGQGVNLTLQTILNDSSASSQILIPKVDYSKINSLSDYTITTGNNNLISGLEIDSDSNKAIKADNKSNLNIIDNKINGEISISSNTNSTNNIVNNNFISPQKITIESLGGSQINNIKNNLNNISQIEVTSSYNSIQTNNITNNNITNNLQATSVNNSEQINYINNNQIGNNVIFSAHNDSKQKYKLVTNNIGGTINQVTSGTATQEILP